jgi:hypothetical protein
MNMSTQDYLELSRRMGLAHPKSAGSSPPRIDADSSAGELAGAKQARAKKRENGLNNTEEKYRLLLEDRKQRGEIQEFFIQAITLKIGTDCRYVPDFLVIQNDGLLTFIEIKGFMHAVGAAKFRVAQQMFWWAEFKLVRRIKGAWVESDKAARNKRKGEV